MAILRLGHVPPPNGGVNVRWGVKKIAIFDQCLTFISEMIQYGAIVTMERQ